MPAKMKLDRENLKAIITFSDKDSMDYYLEFILGDIDED